MPKRSNTDSALDHLTHGVYLVSTAHEGRPLACLTPRLMRAAVRPAAVSFSLPKSARLARTLQEGSALAVSILKAGQRQVAEQLLGADDLPAGLSRDTAGNGAPYLAAGLALLECTITGSLDCGDFTVFAAAVTDSRQLSDGQPLTQRQTGLAIFE